jgi:DNA-binding NtrC family response regulator
MSLYSTCREFSRYLLGWPQQKSTCAPIPRKYELLAISPDIRFFSSLVQTAAPYDWEVRWTRSINGAVEILANGWAPVIIYDCCSATEDWSTSIARLTLLPEAPCIVLAVRQVDEELWRQAINRHVYDVVCRTGHNQHLIATLEFARKWRTDRRHQAVGRLNGRAEHRELELPANQSAS